MRHFAHLAGERHGELFSRSPGTVRPDDTHDRIALGLGAMLYCPATRPRLADDVRRAAAGGVTSTALCLEDAIATADVPAAEANLVTSLGELHADRSAALPLVFVRVRDADQIVRVTARLGAASAALAGFVLPKASPTSGVEMLEAVEAASERSGRHLLAMPVVETPEVLHRETRTEALAELARLFTKFRSRVLAVRIGGTDLCGLYGLRRPRTMSIYDVRVVADVIADVVNVLGRPGEGWRVTGPVWEYFDATDDGPGAAGLRREVALDRVNGLVGKSVIHPGQVAVVHGMSVVSHEDHSDACAVFASTDGVTGPGGAFAGAGHDRMNEPAPHGRWAQEILARAEVFGVAHPHVTQEDLIRAARP